MDDEISFGEKEHRVETEDFHPTSKYSASLHFIDNHPGKINNRYSYTPKKPLGYSKSYYGEKTSETLYKSSVKNSTPQTNQYTPIRST